MNVEYAVFTFVKQAKERHTRILRQAGRHSLTNKKKKKENVPEQAVINSFYSNFSEYTKALKRFQK